MCGRGAMILALIATGGPCLENAAGNILGLVVATKAIPPPIPDNNILLCNYYRPGLQFDKSHLGGYVKIYRFCKKSFST